MCMPLLHYFYPTQVLFTAIHVHVFIITRYMYRLINHVCAQQKLLVEGWLPWRISMGYCISSLHARVIQILEYKISHATHK